MRAYLFKADGDSEDIRPEDEVGGFELSRIQEIVGGYVELISVDPCGVCGSNSKMVMLVNEEGKLKELPKNYMASAVANMDIVGNSVYCPRAWFK